MRAGGHNISALLSVINSVFVIICALCCLCTFAVIGESVSSRSVHTVSYQSPCSCILILGVVLL